MRHKVYRLCLLSVVIIAIVGGIFYYLNYVKDKSDITEGTLVQQGKKQEEKDGVMEEIAKIVVYEEAFDE